MAQLTNQVYGKRRLDFCCVGVTNQGPRGSPFGGAADVASALMATATCVRLFAMLASASAYSLAPRAAYHSHARVAVPVMAMPPNSEKLMTLLRGEEKQKEVC